MESGCAEKTQYYIFGRGVLNKTIASNYTDDNAHNKYAVAVKFNGSVVGHVPREVIYTIRK